MWLDPRTATRVGFRSVTAPFITEQGPEAAATRARLTDRRCVMQGEGDSAWVGRDADTFCLCSDGGTALDILDDADVNEADLRAAATVRRFSSQESLERAIAVLTESIVRRRGWAVRDPEPRLDSDSPMRFEFALGAGLSNSEVHSPRTATRGDPSRDTRAFSKGSPGSPGKSSLRPTSGLASEPSCCCFVHRIGAGTWLRLWMASAGRCNSTGFLEPRRAEPTRIRLRVLARG